jgi:hypothetical protein
MIAAASKFAWDKPPINWFDVMLILIMAFGLWRGRKRGMSKEFVSVFEVLLMVIACGFGYEWVSPYLIQSGLIHSVFFSFDQRTAACVSSYVLIGVLVVFAFSFIKRYLKPKLEGSNAFGGSEYYLGMFCGMIRYGCAVVIVLALLNAPVYTESEIQAKKAYNNRWYGGGMKDFKGDFFPSLDEVQVSVFKESLCGPFMKKHLGIWFINPAAPQKKKPANPPVV